MAQVSIIAERGSHLLLQRRGRLAIVERRGDRIYGVGAKAEEGFPDTLDGMVEAVGEAGGWGDAGEVRAAFEEITERGEALAQKIW